MSSNPPSLDTTTPSWRVRPGWGRGRVLFLAISGVAAVALFFAVREVLLPFVMAIIIAYVLTPLVALCERLRLPRSVSILVVYAATFAVVYVSIATVAPRIYKESVQLAVDTPNLARRLAAHWSPRVESWVSGFLHRLDGSPPATPADAESSALEVRKRPDGSYGIEVGSGIEVIQDAPKRWLIQKAQPETASAFRVGELVDGAINRFMGYIAQNAIELIKVGQVVLSRATRAVFLLFMTLMVAGYLMHTREAILGFFRTLPPPRARQSFDRLIERMDRGLAGVVRGQLLICAMNGVFSAVGFWFFDLKYWPILAIVAAVMSLIPIFGSILSSIPAVLIGLTQDFWTALWVLLWILGIHQVEANLLNPKIIGVAARIHPVLVVFALIVGEHFWGLWGALLAVPTLSLTQSVFNHFRFESLPDAEPDSLAPPRAGVAPSG